MPSCLLPVRQHAPERKPRMEPSRLWVAGLRGRCHHICFLCASARSRTEAKNVARQTLLRILDMGRADLISHLSTSRKGLGRIHCIPAWVSACVIHRLQSCWDSCSYRNTAPTETETEWNGGWFSDVRGSTDREWTDIVTQQHICDEI